jgi:hypothetical protein
MLTVFTMLEREGLVIHSASGTPLDVSDVDYSAMY